MNRRGFLGILIGLAVAPFARARLIAQDIPFNGPWGAWLHSITGEYERSGCELTTIYSDHALVLRYANNMRLFERDGMIHWGPWRRWCYATSPEEAQAILQEFRAVSANPPAPTGESPVGPI